MQSVFLAPVIFLGACGFVVVILVCFYLFLNKQACFKKIGGFSCIEQPAFDDEHPINAEESSEDDSEDEVRNNFNKLQRGESFKAAASKSSRDQVDQDGFSDGVSLVSGVPKSESLRTADETQSLLWGSKTPSKARSVVSYGESVGPGAMGVAQSMATSTTVSGGEHSDDSEHLSDNSSMTQYSEDFGDSPQGVSAFAEASDEEDNKMPVANVTTLGQLNLGILYESRKARLKVRIRNVKDVPDRERGGTTAYQLHVVLLPDKRQRFKTKQKPASRLGFDETFVFTKVSATAIAEQALRVRLYGCERMRRERLVAETVVALTTFELTSDEKQFDIPLEPRTKLKSRKKSGDSLSDTSSYASLEGVIPHGNNLPELLLGLSYNGTTGRLSVEVIRGSIFYAPNLAGPPDSFVKLSLLSSNGQVFARSKTSVRRHDPNPLFKETFMFQIAMFQLEDITLMVFVYHKKNIRRKKSIGWFSLGLNSSGEEEVSHWQDMRDAMGDRVVRWHLLLEPS